MEKNKIITFSYLILSISIIMLPIDSMCAAFYFVAVSFIITGLIPKKGIKHIIPSIILSIIFLLSLSYREILKTTFMSNTNILIRYVCMPFLIMHSSIINIDYLINKVSSIRDKLSIKVNKKNIKKYLFIIAIIITILSIISNISYYTYSDMEKMIAYYYNHKWNDYNTIGYQLFFNLIFGTFKLRTAVVIIQASIWLYIYKYALDTIDNNYGNKSSILFTIIGCIFIEPYVFIHMPFKDILFASGVLGITVYIYNLIYKNKLNNKDKVIGLISILFITLFRHLGNILALVLLFILLICFYKKSKYKTKMIKLGILTSILSYLVVNILVGTFILHMEKDNSFVNSSINIYMAASFVNDDPSYLTDEEIKTLELIMPIEEYQSGFNKYWVDSVSRSWGTPGRRIYNFDKYDLSDEFMKMNIRLFINHPLKYIDKLFTINSIVFEIGTPNDGFDWAPVKGHSIEYDKVEDSIIKWPVGNLVRYLEYLSGKIPIIKDIIWRGGTTTFINIVLLVICIIYKNKKYILVLLPIILIQLVLYYATPSQAPRYLLSLYMVLPFITTIILNKEDRIN